MPLPLLVLGSQHLSRWCSQGRPAAPVIHDLVSLGPASAFTELWLRTPHPRHGHLATGNHSGHFWVLCVSLEYRGHRGKLRSSLSFHLTTRFHLVKCASQPKRLLLEPYMGFRIEMSCPLVSPFLSNTYDHTSLHLDEA